MSSSVPPLGQLSVECTRARRLPTRFPRKVGVSRFRSQHISRRFLSLGRFTSSNRVNPHFCQSFFCSCSQHLGCGFHCAHALFRFLVQTTVPARRDSSFVPSQAKPQNQDMHNRHCANIRTKLERYDNKTLAVPIGLAALCPTTA